MFDSLVSSIEHIRAGELRALAVTSARRLEALSDIPTVAESIPGYEATAVSGLGAPKATPVEIIEKLNKEINAGLANPRFAARVADLGAAPLPMAPAEFGRFMAEETVKWGKVIRAANIKVE